MVFTDQQLRLLRVYINALKPHFWTACSLLYYCYIRPNELRYLKVENLDLIRNKIFLSHTFAKNKKDNFVTIPKPLRTQIEYIKKLPPQYFLFGNNHNFLPSREMLNRDRMSRYFSKVLKILGFTGRYSFYSLKHTGIERAVRAGVNIKEIQVQLRHHSLDMVNEYLKNLGAFELKDIDNKFPPIA